MKNAVDIAATTQKVVPVDNRIPLRYYYRIAGNLLNQGRVYRKENNIVDLYIILIRFSSLVSETIPRHQDYPAYVAKDKADYKQKLRDVVDELEALKPEVQRQAGEPNKGSASQNTRKGYDYGCYTSSQDNAHSGELPHEKGQVYQTYQNGKECGSIGKICTLQNAWVDDNNNRWLSSNQMEEQLSKLSLHVPKPRDETLSRHSFLKSSCLQGKWEPSHTHTRVEYPGNIDLSPIEIPRLDHIGESSLSTTNFGSVDFGVKPTPVNGSCFLPAADSYNSNSHVHIFRQPTPSPVLSYVQSIPTELNYQDHVSSFTVVDTRLGSVTSFQDELPQSTSPQYVQISPKLMEDFLKLAKSNTEKNMETCGVLAGSLKQRTFYVTTLIIPKQESTSDSCYTMNEEEIYTVQDERSLFPLGWIHTHPSQSCFMSSVDLHTQYSYQIMLPEAIAIVMAPTDSSRKYGIFRLSDPGGIAVLKQCQQRGFHPHEEPPDGSPIYDHCSNVLMDPNLKFDVVDIR